MGKKFEHFLWKITILCYKVIYTYIITIKLYTSEILKRNYALLVTIFKTMYSSCCVNIINGKNTWKFNTRCPIKFSLKRLKQNLTYLYCELFFYKRLIFKFWWRFVKKYVNSKLFCSWKFIKCFHDIGLKIVYQINHIVSIMAVTKKYKNQLV